MVFTWSVVAVTVLLLLICARRNHSNRLRKIEDEFFLLSRFIMNEMQGETSIQAWHELLGICRRIDIQYLAYHPLAWPQTCEGMTIAKLNELRGVN